MPDLSGTGTKTLEYYYSYTPDNEATPGSLYALSPTNPTGAAQVVDANVLNNEVETGAISFFPVISRSSHEQHPAYVFYLRQGGGFWRVSTDIGGSPTPKRVSNAIVDPRNICFMDIGTSPSAPLDTPVVYAVNTNGSVGCDSVDRELQWYWIKVGDGASVLPQTFPVPDEQVVSSSIPGFPGLPGLETLDDPIVVSLSDPGTGVHSGWLIVQSDKLVLVKPNGQKAPVGPGAGMTVQKSVELLSWVNLPGYMLNIDGKLYAYDRDTNTISSALHTFTDTSGIELMPSPSAYSTDGERLYFIDGDTLYRSSLCTATLKDVEIMDSNDDPKPSTPGGGLDAGLIVGTDHVAWVMTREGATADSGDDVEVLRSVTKDATPVASSLVTADHRAGKEFVGFIKLFGPGVSGQHIFYTLSAGSTNTAYSSKMDGTGKVSKTDALWVGTSARGLYIYRIDGAGSGASLVSVPTDSPTTSYTLGTIDSDICMLGALGMITPGYGPGRIIMGTFDKNKATCDMVGGSGLPTMEPQMDVLYFDQAAGGSLGRITHTSDKNEMQVPLF